MLTDEEISEVAISNSPNVHIYARAIEAAVLAKLAAAEMQEPVAWLFTNVQSGDIEVSTDEDLYSSGYWHKQPLYTRSTT